MWYLLNGLLTNFTPVSLTETYKHIERDIWRKHHLTLECKPSTGNLLSSLLEIVFCIVERTLTEICTPEVVWNDFSIEETFDEHHSELLYYSSFQ